MWVKIKLAEHNADALDGNCCRSYIFFCESLEVLGLIGDLGYKFLLPPRPLNNSLASFGELCLLGSCFSWLAFTYQSVVTPVPPPSLAPFCSLLSLSSHNAHWSAAKELVVSSNAVLKIDFDRLYSKSFPFFSDLLLFLSSPWELFVLSLT